MSRSSQQPECRQQPAAAVRLVAVSLSRSSCGSGLLVGEIITLHCCVFDHTVATLTLVLAARIDSDVPGVSLTPTARVLHTKHSAQRPPNQHTRYTNTDNGQQHGSSTEQNQEDPTVRRCTGRLGVPAAAVAAAVLLRVGTVAHRGTTVVPSANISSTIIKSSQKAEQKKKKKNYLLSRFHGSSYSKTSRQILSPRQTEALLVMRDETTSRGA